jgi:NitT/TauT family transport system substrate-binding protein
MKIKLVVLSALVAMLLQSACTNNAANTSTSTVTSSDTEAVQPTSMLIQPTVEPTPYETVTLTVNQSNKISYAPIFIADKEGYFAQYGIELTYEKFNKTADALPLLISGDLDVYFGVVNTGLFNVIRQEPNVKVVADRGSVNTGDCTFLGIVVRKDLFDSGQITSAKDLKGQTIAASLAGENGFLLAQYLESAGLTLDDVVTNDIPSATYLDALANKTVAAFVTEEWQISSLLATGNAVILASAQDIVGPLQTSVVVFGKSLYADHPELGVRFLAAYLKGVARYNEGKTDSNLQILADATGANIDVLRNACWLPIHNDGSINFLAVDPFQQWSIEQKQLDQPVTEEQFWDPSFLVRANNLLGQ